MKRPIICWPLPVLLALWLAWGAVPVGADAPVSATEFLKQSMSRYQALTSFQAECGWNETFGGVALPKAAGQDADVRAIVYVRPNQFKVTSSHYGVGFVQTSVSDGKHLVEYSSMTTLPAMTYAAPATIAQASSMQMGHPMFCGTLLYQFFGGPDNLAKLADTGKMPIAYGPDVVIGDEPCKTVLLYAQGLYGHTAIAISTRDNLIRQITYDSAPLMAMMGAQKLPQAKKSVLPTSSSTTEDYRRIVTNQPVASTAFDTTLPKGQSVTDMSAAGGESTPPVAIGAAAPNFTVSRLSNRQPVTLSSLRGQVTLLDFWATWCPPCRKSLPETQALAREFGGKGLAVMTISDEEPATIAAFLKSNHYTFPAYRDAAGAAGKAYKVTAIPTLVVLDRKGRLVAYLVGLQERETVGAALKKAGLQIP